MELTTDQLITIFSVLAIVYVVLIWGMIWYVKGGEDEK